MSDGGFNFNQWQQQQHQNAGPTEAATPDSLTQDGLNKTVHFFFKFFGINPDLNGHGVVPGETNVSGGLSMQHGAMVKDAPGGVLAGILKYFTRDLPQIFTGGEGGDAGAGGGSGGEGAFGDGGGSVHAGGGDLGGGFSGGAGMDGGEMINYGGKLMASEPMDISVARLGELTPQATPDSGGRGVDAGMDIG